MRVERRVYVGKLVRPNSGMVTAPPPRPNRRRCGSRKIRAVQTKDCATRPREEPVLSKLGVGTWPQKQNLTSEVRLDTLVCRAGFYSRLHTQ